jgi:hypothetical protein
MRWLRRTKSRLPDQPDARPHREPRSSRSTAATRAHLDVILDYDRDIALDALDELQDFLASMAPGWSQRARAKRYGAPDVPIDMSSARTLKDVSVAVGMERGPLFRSLTGSADVERFGTVELRGTTRALVVVISFDVRQYRHAGPAIRRGNRIALQVRAKKIDGIDAGAWAERAMVELCVRTGPAFARAGLVDEFWASNMHDEADGLHAVGVDISRWVPGLYWLTFFGPPYVALFGEEELRTAPGPRVGHLDSGYLLGLGESPGQWAAPSYQQTSTAIKAHLGDRFFWDKTHPERETIGLDVRA